MKTSNDDNEYFMKTSNKGNEYCVKASNDDNEYCTKDSNDELVSLLLVSLGLLSPKYKR